jgi:hypothetical protein
MKRPTVAHCAAALLIPATSFSIAIPAASAVNGGTVVPLRSILRACDFTPINGGAPQNNASVTSVIHANGGTVSADVRLSNPGAAGTYYDVRLIQAPRAANAPCDFGGPGVATGGLATDAVGQASTTVQGSIQSGAAGAWVFVSRPSPYSQAPAEYYTSDFVAPV